MLLSQSDEESKLLNSFERTRIRWKWMFGIINVTVLLPGPHVMVLNEMDQKACFSVAMVSKCNLLHCNQLAAPSHKVCFYTSFIHIIHLSRTGPGLFTGGADSVLFPSQDEILLKKRRVFLILLYLASIRGRYDFKFHVWVSVSASSQKKFPCEQEDKHSNMLMDQRERQSVFQSERKCFARIRLMALAMQTWSRCDSIDPPGGWVFRVSVVLWGTRVSSCHSFRSTSLFSLLSSLVSRWF